MGMRPEEQHPGGGGNPPWQNPYQQPGYQQQNPYQQGAEQWAQQSGQWSAPAPPSGPVKPGTEKRGRGRVAVAVAVATAVVAAAVVTGVVVLGGDDGDEARARGGDHDTGAPPADGGDEADDGGEGGDDRQHPDDPRQGVLQRPDPVVAPDWQVQTIEERGNAFDVPPEDWTTSAESMVYGFEDQREDSDTQGDPLIMMSAVAVYMDGWCPEAEYGVSSHAMAGTKGGQGATSTEEAAVTEAENWALAGYDQEQEGNLQVSDPEPFESDHGLTGHTVTATITDVPEDPDDPCGTFDGKVTTVSYLDSNNDLATWAIVANAGFEDELPDETIEQIMNSLRPYPAED